MLTYPWRLGSLFTKVRVIWTRTKWWCWSRGKPAATGFRKDQGNFLQALNPTRRWVLNHRREPPNLLAALACLAGFSDQAAERKPNILLILIRAGVELEKVAAARS
jgi:hypothetical protein